MSDVSKRKWISFIGSFCCLPLLGCWASQQAIVFRKTSSPNNTYSVNLKGGKGAPDGHVHADVFKKGQSFISDILLHSGGETFRPFEDAYPDLRWSNEHVLEFYRRETYEQGSDLIQVINKSTKPVSYLLVESVNKFLLFDVQPGAASSLAVPASSLDSQWIGVEGVFSNGKKLLFTSRSLNRSASQHSSSVYVIVISDSELTIEAEGV